MTKYIRRKFLLNDTDYENQTLDVRRREADDGVLPLGTPWNLSDCVAPRYERAVSINDMNRTIDTEDDWNVFIANVRHLDLLIIDVGGVFSTNPIAGAYRVATVKAYAARLTAAGVNCALVS